MKYESLTWASDVDAEHETEDLSTKVALGFNGIYEQRIENGIKSEREIFKNFSYSGDPKYLAPIEAFLKAHGCVKAFYLDIPDIYPEKILVRREGNIKRVFIGGTQKRLSFDLIEVMA